MIKKLLALITFVSVIGALVFFAQPLSIKIGESARVETLSVDAQDLRLVCPGGAINSAGSNGTAVGRFSHIGNALITGSNGSGVTVDFSNFNNLDSEPNTATATRSASGIFNWASATGSSILAKGSGEQGTGMVHAAQWQNVASPLLNGLLATSCQTPSPEHWLVGGDASTGRETLLVLANPGSVAATANLEVFSEGGQVVASGLSGISVAAGSQTVVPLSSLIPETRTFAIHVMSKSGALAAWLQQRTVRGLLYAGADYVSPTTTIGKEISIAGIFIRGVADAAGLIAANSDYADLKPVLRVFNASDKVATFTAQFNGASATTFGTVIQDTVAARSVKDFAIESLANGDYSAFIDSDQNITAAIRLARTDKTKKPNTDFTWLQTVETFTGERHITIPSVGITKLSVVNPNSTPTSVTINSVNYLVGAKSSIVLRVENSSKVTIRASDLPIGATALIDIDSSIANLAVVNYKNSGGEVAVRVR